MLQTLRSNTFGNIQGSKSALSFNLVCNRCTECNTATKLASIQQVPTFQHGHGIEGVRKWLTRTQALNPTGGLSWSAWTGPVRVISWERDGSEHRENSERKCAKRPETRAAPEVRMITAERRETCVTRNEETTTWKQDYITNSLKLSMTNHVMIKVLLFKL